jgi:hypothetical protein
MVMRFASSSRLIGPSENNRLKAEKYLTVFSARSGLRAGRDDDYRVLRTA